MDKGSITSSWRQGNRPMCYDALTGLRFLAIAVIVVHHADLFFPSVAARGFYGGQASSLFFVLSGFGLWCGYGRRLITGEDIVKFYAKRMISLYPLYVISFLLMWLWYSIAGRPVESGILFSNVLMMQSWIPFSEYYFGVTSAGWFVSTLLSLYVVFPVICRYRKACFGIALISAVWGPEIMTSLYAMLDVAADVSKVAYVNPFCRLPDFCLGILIAQMTENVEVGRERKWSLISVLIDVGAIVLLLGYTRISVLHGTGMDRTLFLVPIFILLVDLLLNNGFLRRILGCRWCVFMGNAAFSMFLLHLPIRCYLFNSGIIPVKGVVGFVIYFIIVLLVSVAVSRYCVLPFSRYLRRVILPLLDGVVERASFGKAKILYLSVMISLAALPLAWYYFRENRVVISNAQAECDFILPNQFVALPRNCFSIHPGEKPTMVTFDINGSPLEISFYAKVLDKRGNVTISVFADDSAVQKATLTNGEERQFKISVKGVRKLKIEVDKNGDISYDTVVFRDFCGSGISRWRNRRTKSTGTS